MKKLLLLSAAFLGVVACGEKNSSVQPVAQPKAEVKPVPPVQKTTAQKETIGFSWLKNIDEANEFSEDSLAQNYYVIVDGSGSMMGAKCSGGYTKMEVAQQALKAFSESVPADANLGMLAFDGRGIREYLPLGLNNRLDFIAKVERIRPYSGTPLKSAIGLAYQKLKEQAQKQLGYGEYHLVVVTDGEASPNEDPSSVLKQVYRESPVVLHTIGFCISNNHSLNNPENAYYKSAGNPEALKEGLESVLAESDSFTVTTF